jgi:hypothetical protein
VRPLDLVLAPLRILSSLLGLVGAGFVLLSVLLRLLTAYVGEDTTLSEGLTGDCWQGTLADD